MRLSSLVVAVFLLVPPVVFAQRSSGGGASSGGSSGGFSSSGGSHGSYSGGSSSGSSSSSAHSSGNSAASSSNHSPSRSASRSSSTGSAAQHQIGKNARVQGSNAAESIRNLQPARRGFIAFLRHPFRKRAEAGLRRPIVCKDKPCPCPPGETNGKNGACLAIVTTNHFRRCPQGEYWGGGGCTTVSLFRSDDCSNLALALDRQARQSQLAESSRQTSCSSNAAAQECSELMAKSQNEAALYKSLHQQYEQCKRQRLVGLPDSSAVPLRASIRVSDVLRWTEAAEEAAGSGVKYSNSAAFSGLSFTVSPN